ncbi:NAD(P)/FAD-dependent oxidoreductase [Cohaesibacter gelatinilyticus]|uniref:Glycine/D-amino acid oxidase n=1 Tax=Cohaesibacter gelatinilyticus TaxID=372072 RepID=A0A285PFB3_9HYPH|nr:FAD-dependent oxidoreductase [Cohaesibacter gelatinilyticus]SNZ20399.1 Glycine/D-amino acid oxidase [Cohaesibacter gelatinilyticus]
MRTIVVGGGVVGLSLAYGLLKAGQPVLVLDGSDGDFRASRGNFGLVWVQGKGADFPPYARWTRTSAKLWSGFAKELEELTNLKLSYENKGGVEYCFSAQEMKERKAELSALRDKLDGDYPFEMLSAEQLKKKIPQIGPKVYGASYCPEDSHVNPLSLLRALSQAVRMLGGDIRTNIRVMEIIPGENQAELITENSERFVADRLVLAAGLGAQALGPQLGFKALVRPQQGQVLITEKMPHFLDHPSGTLRQVNEGGVQIGASKAEVGLNDHEDVLTTASLAAHAADVFPMLANAQIVRSWAALRVMSPDGYPIYQRSDKHHYAWFVTCHSGITLAAAHCELLPRWIMSKNDAPDLSPFSEARF